MSSREASEGRSLRGSNVYLTTMEKEALKRAIDQYNTNVSAASDENFIEFYQKYDEAPLESAIKKLEK